MKPTKPAKNDLCSAKEFKTLCVSTIRGLSTDGKKYRLEDEVIRHLRFSMLVTVDTKEHLPEAVAVILTAITAQVTSVKTTTKIRKADIEGWLTADDEDEDVDEDEAEWEADEDVFEKRTHQVRRILDSYKEDTPKGEKKVTYYLVDCEPTWEPADNLNRTMIARFYIAHRALVRRTYNDDQAVEAGRG